MSMAERLQQGARMYAQQQIEGQRPRAGSEFWNSDCPECGERRSATGGDRGPACSCEGEQFARFVEAYVAERRPGCAARVIEAAGIPRRHEPCSFDSFTKRNGTADALKASQAWAEAFSLETETGLLFSGAFGAGKTHLAVAALRRAIQRTLVEGRFISAGALVSGVRSGERITWKPVEDAIGAELLVLDDFGQEAGTEFTRDIVARVIFGRYEAARPTIITTNLGPKALTETFGGAVVSRLHEMTRPLVVSATDYRRKAS